MTLEWTGYAQSLTDKPMKAMLTGPVTMLNWSFVRDDQPRSKSCLQLALAIRAEVLVNDIIAAIAAMDADVITIETARSNMELLDAFDDFAYPNAIGPGVYDIHSPNIPSPEHMVELMRKAAQRVPSARLWVNPDRGLKTRTWSEVLPALKNMVAAAHILRRQV